MNLHSRRVTQLAELSGFTQAIGLEDSQNRTTCEEGQRLGPSQPAALVTCQADPGAPDQAAQADDDPREPFSCLHAYLSDDRPKKRCLELSGAQTPPLLRLESSRHVFFQSPAVSLGLAVWANTSPP